MKKEFKTINMDGLIALKQIEVVLPYMSEEQKHELAMIAKGMVLEKEQKDDRISELEREVRTLRAKLEQKAG